MVSTVAAERSRLHDQYPPLRACILDHYHLRAELTGSSVDAQTYKLPRKLGHWGPQHSERVLAACPELERVVRAIEGLRARRATEVIEANHVKRSKRTHVSWAARY